MRTSLLTFAGSWPQQFKKVSSFSQNSANKLVAPSDVFQKQPRFAGGSRRVPVSDFYKVEDTSNPELMERFRRDIISLKGDYEEIPIEDKDGNQTAASLFVFGKTKDALKKAQEKNPTSGRGDFAEGLEQVWNKLDDSVKQRQTYS